MKCLLVTTLLLPISSFAADEKYGANPIRRVVTMLQSMEKKVHEEGEKEEDLFEKFMCYCKENTGELTKSIREAQTKIAELEAQVKGDTAAKAQNDEELVQHKKDRVDAKASLAAATKLREEEAAQYAKDSGDMGINAEALTKAINALEQGLGSGGVLLQANTLQTIKPLIQKVMSTQVSETRRFKIASFLSEEEGAPGSSQIVGILKEMKDEMNRDLGGIIETEEQAKTSFSELSAAKKKEIAASTRAIEKKTQRSGDLAVRIVRGQDDLEDTMNALSEDEQFQVNLRTSCATKDTEWNERQKTRAEELRAIAETIKVLNDDDALELFKKTMPSKGKSFLQETTASVKTIQRRARNIIKQVAKTYKSTAAKLDLISLALRAKNVDFTKVIKMVDDLVLVLIQEQKDDDAHKEYCVAEFDTSDDKKKETQRSITDDQHVKEEAETVSSNLAGEIKVLQQGIADLDKSVAEATEQRKNEHAEFVQTSAENQGALDLLAFAKNRLNKFYNPKLYKAPPPRDLTEEERILDNFGELEAAPAAGGIAGTGITVFTQLSSNVAPPPPPETYDAYSKKSGESGGVIALMDMMVNDLKKDMHQAEFDEKDSQEEYEELMADSQKKRAADSKSVTTKESAKAEADVQAQSALESLKSHTAELVATKEYIANLHKSCDFLTDNYEFRKNGRAQEVDALKKAKAVLNGANFSLLQQPNHDAVAKKHEFLKAY